MGWACIALRRNHLVGSSERLRHALVAAAIFNGEILALGQSKLVQLGNEDLIPWPCHRISQVGAQNADTGDPARILRAYGERPSNHRAAEKCDKFASPHGSSSS